MTRAAFWLFAVVVVTAVFFAALSVAGCAIGVYRHDVTMDECRKMDLRGFIQDIIVLLLALLGRAPPSPPAKPPSQESH
jgi:hypothetical protein